MTSRGGRAEWYDEIVILHRYPYRETGVLLKCFSPHQGFITLMAHTNRSQRGMQKGALTLFSRYGVQLSGTKELKTLRQYEWLGSVKPNGIELYASLYVNELLLCLGQWSSGIAGLSSLKNGSFQDRQSLEMNHGLQEGRCLEDASDFQQLYLQYWDFLHAIEKPRLQEDRSSLTDESAQHDSVMLTGLVRAFEAALLSAMGVMPPLDQDRNGHPIDPASYYQLPQESLPVWNAKGVYKGEWLLKIHARQFDDPEVNKAAKRVFQGMLRHIFGRSYFRSRAVLAAIFQKSLSKL